MATTVVSIINKTSDDVNNLKNEMTLIHTRVESNQSLDKDEDEKENDETKLDEREGQIIAYNSPSILVNSSKINKTPTRDMMLTSASLNDILISSVTSDNSTSRTASIHNSITTTNVSNSIGSASSSNNTGISRFLAIRNWLKQNKWRRKEKNSSTFQKEHHNSSQTSPSTFIAANTSFDSVYSTNSTYLNDITSNATMTNTTTTTTKKSGKFLKNRFLNRKKLNVDVTCSNNANAQILPKTNTSNTSLTASINNIYSKPITTIKLTDSNNLTSESDDRSLKDEQEKIVELKSKQVSPSLSSKLIHKLNKETDSISLNQIIESFNSPSAALILPDHSISTPNSKNILIGNNQAPLNDLLNSNLTNSNFFFHLFIIFHLQISFFFINIFSALSSSSFTS